MKVLFVHQNMPGQFKHLAPALAAEGHEVVFLTKPGKPNSPGVRQVQYKLHREPNKAGHDYFDRLDDQMLHGQAVVRECIKLRQQGFVPDVICAHSGWGEAMFLKDAYPASRLLTFNEFYYRSKGTDTDFGQREPSIDLQCRTRVRNMHMLLSMSIADWGYVPTYWQWATHPKLHRRNMTVIHDGIDTEACRRHPDAKIELADGRVLTAADEVVTYVARNLEPYRGFDIFAKTIVPILEARPKAEIVIVGGEDVSYGIGPGHAESWKDALIPHLGFDAARVHFLGRIPYAAFGDMLSVSRVHVYLTYPFVLSWSLLEAMAKNCLVVASDTAPVREVVRHGENGFLVDYFDHAALAGQVIQALDRGAALDPVRRAARQTVVDRYDLKTICLPAQLDIIRSLARGEKPQPTTDIPADIAAAMGWPSRHAEDLELWGEW